jgi:competence protein ComEA
MRGRLAGTVPLLDPGVPGLRVLVVLGTLAAVVAGIFAWRSRPVAEPLAPPAPVNVSSAVASPSPTASVVVYVTGKVRRPGVLSLATGSRVADAIEAAGGVRPGAKPGAVNLARRLVDGEQIVVGSPTPMTPGDGPSAGSPGSAAGGLLSLNSATAEQLNGLPGVGDVLAERIIEFREAHGGFQSVDQLREVSGVGEKRFSEIKDKVAL